MFIFPYHKRQQSLTNSSQFSSKLKHLSWNFEWNWIKRNKGTVSSNNIYFHVRTKYNWLHVDAETSIFHSFTWGYFVKHWIRLKTTFVLLNCAEFYAVYLMHFKPPTFHRPHSGLHPCFVCSQVASNAYDVCIFGGQKQKAGFYHPISLVQKRQVSPEWHFCKIFGCTSLMTSWLLILSMAGRLTVSMLASRPDSPSQVALRWLPPQTRHLSGWM